MTAKTKEPDWNVLFNFGLPMNIAQSGNIVSQYEEVFKNIVLSSHFLIENKNNINYNRYSDSFKALLLALKIHYPSKFIEIENRTGFDLTVSFNLDNVSVRDIKLRRLCLSGIVNYFKDNL